MKDLSEPVATGIEHEMRRELMSLITLSGSTIRGVGTRRSVGWAPWSSKDGLKKLRAANARPGAVNLLQRKRNLLFCVPRFPHRMTSAREGVIMPNFPSLNGTESSNHPNLNVIFNPSQQGSMAFPQYASSNSCRC
jgi:hypothetical protein